MYSYLCEFLKYMVDDWERRVSLDSDNAGQMEAMWKSAFLLAKPLLSVEAVVFVYFIMFSSQLIFFCFLI